MSKIFKFYMRRREIERWFVNPGLFVSDEFALNIFNKIFYNIGLGNVFIKSSKPVLGAITISAIFSFLEEDCNIYYNLKTDQAEIITNKENVEVWHYPVFCFFHIYDHLKITDRLKSLSMHKLADKASMIGTYNIYDRELYFLDVSDESQETIDLLISLTQI